MGRAVTRASVCCASGFEWAALVLLIFSTASGYWSWGTAQTSVSGYSSVTASTGPWIAGSTWSSYPVPCNCVNGFCYNYCYMGTTQVRWGAIPAAAACGPQSLVYQKWSGPLGYCSFPGGTPPPTTSPSGPIPDNATGENTFGNVPEGATFNTPSQIPAIQGLSIVGTITVFFAAVAGCVDAGMENKGSMPAAIAASFCSFVAFVFTLTSYCLWAAFPYVQTLQTSSPSPIYIPVWLNEQQNQLTAVPIYGVVYGPGFATAITASIVIFFCMLVHCASLAMSRTSGEDSTFFSSKGGGNNAPRSGPTMMGTENVVSPQPGAGNPPGTVSKV